MMAGALFVLIALAALTACQPQPTPVAPPGRGEDATLVLPESAEPLHRASVDLEGDGVVEEVVLTGWGGDADRLGYDFLQMFVVVPAEGGGYEVAWQSSQLQTDRAEPLRVEDINGDGRPEVVSVQAMGASGERLYVLAAREEDYGWLAPHGGHFAGEDAFGETGASMEDRDGDGVMAILASYGGASRFTDVYGWDGKAYVYRETVE